MHALRSLLFCFGVAAWTVACPSLAWSAAEPLSEEPVKYAAGHWSPDQLGNHRARISVAGAADAVWVRIPWRRRDDHPERKEIIVVDAATGKRVANVLRVDVRGPYGDLLFQPVTAPGEYYVYFMPFRTTGSWYFPTTEYLEPTDTADKAWARKQQPLAERIRNGQTDSIARAKVIELQAFDDFHRFDPMEVAATPEEVARLVARQSEKRLLVFPEDRTRPIRMFDNLPLCWNQRGPEDRFAGEACRNEYYVFQLGLFAPDAAVQNVRLQFSDLKSGSGRVIPASALCCFNLGGTDWLGRPFTKRVDVEAGHVQPLWIGVDVAESTEPGRYEGTITVGADGLPGQTIAVSIAVNDTVLPERGDGDLWRLSRLRWLNSTSGLDDEVLAPFTPVRQQDRTVFILGRSVRFAPSGLLESITGTFSRNVDRVDAEARELLAAPMRFVVTPAGQAPADFEYGEPEIVARSAGAVTWRAAGRSGPMTLGCEAKMECDGYVNYRVTLRSAEPIDLDDLRLEIPAHRAAAGLMMGMGRKGGNRPDQWHWKWDVNLSNNQFWIGDVNLGVSCKLKHVEDRWDLFNTKETGGYRDWFDGTHGGCDITEQGDRVLASVYTGPRRLEPGRELCFRFGLLITPVKTLDKGHWQWRYYHRNGTPPVDEIKPTGANIINVHQGDALNPYINYPFGNEKPIKEYVDRAHAAGMRVKLYYTIRELSNHTAEIWALRSLGDEVYVHGDGFRLADAFADEKAGAKPNTGGPWLCEHLITGYKPAWHTPLGGGRQDAAIATTGLSRWHNYYLEGLGWLIRRDGVDGLYLDGVGYDREIMKRVRKVIERSRPGCLIDFHSGNHFHPVYGLNNCANLYIELFPYIDSLWFGEGFDYNEPPDYWLVEVAGIPYGLFGEMLHGGGNPWRGMLYGMTSRLGWSGDPRPIWKLWDRFGIDQARMIGYWDEQCPAKTGHDQVLATAYMRPGQTLVSIASWAPGPVDVNLRVDWEALHLDPQKASLYAPPIEGFQPEMLFRPDEPIPVMPGRGWLLLVDEKKRELAPPEDPLAGCKLIERETFNGPALADAWKKTESKHPGTSIGLVEGRLQVAGAANVVAYVQRPLPEGVSAVACTIRMDTDAGASWGPGMALVWPDGRSLRVNLRAEGRFGVDDGRQQRLTGLLRMDQPARVAIRLTGKRIVVTAAQGERLVQKLAELPRTDFPGPPSAIRVGKMGPHAANTDYTTPGPPGTTTLDDLELYAPAGE